MTPFTLNEKAKLVHISSQVEDQSKEVVPERSLTPFLLVQFGDEACFSSPQNIVTGKVHGSVEVADGNAEP